MQHVLPRYFKTYRKRFGIQQSQLARLLGTHQSHISKVESGRCAPTLDTLLGYHVLFDVELDHLVPEQYRTVHQQLQNRIEHRPYLISDKAILESVQRRFTRQSDLWQKQQKDDPGNQRLLSLYPQTLGCSFAFFENPKNLVDWGNLRGGNRYVTKNLHRLIKEYAPNTLVTQDKEMCPKPVGEKRINLLESIYEISEKYSIALYAYNRASVKAFFNRFNAHNKTENARLLATWFSGLPQPPPNPKLWDAPHCRMGVMDAISFALTHYHKDD